MVWADRGQQQQRIPKFIEPYYKAVFFYSDLELVKLLALLFAIT